METELKLLNFAFVPLSDEASSDEDMGSSDYDAEDEDDEEDAEDLAAESDEDEDDGLGTGIE